MNKESKEILKICREYFKENFMFTESFYEAAIVNNLLSDRQVSFIKKNNRSKPTQVMALFEKLEFGDNTTIPKLLKTLKESENENCAIYIEDLQRRISIPADLCDNPIEEIYTVNSNLAHILILKCIPLAQDDPDNENFPFITYGDTEILYKFFKDLHYNTTVKDFSTGQRPEVEAYHFATEYILNLKSEINLIGLLVICEGNDDFICSKGYETKKEEFYSNELFGKKFEDIPKFVMFFTKIVHPSKSTLCLKAMKNGYIVDLTCQRVKGRNSTSRSYAALWLELVHMHKKLGIVRLMQEFNTILQRDYPGQKLLNPWFSLSKSLRFFPLIQ